MKKTVLILLKFLLIFSGFIATAQDNQTQYTENVHYNILDPLFDTENKEQVIIYEFFGYKCPHCATFQAFSEPWKKQLPKHIKLVRVPVVFQAGWDILAKAYYTADTMGIIEKTHQAMFQAIHKQRKRFRTIEDIADWYAENFNVDKAAFISTADSFMIDSMLRQANNMVREMKITSTPAIIIHGKYKPNRKSLSTNGELLNMAAFLAEQEAKTMGLK